MVKKISYSVHIMDPFTTPPRKQHRFSSVPTKHIRKQDVISIIKSLPFESLQLPLEMATSENEAHTSDFVRVLCDALAESMIQSMPSDYSPRKLVEASTKSQKPVSTAIGHPHPIEIGASMDPRFAEFPLLYDDVVTGKRTGMISHLLSNKVTARPGRKRPSAKDGPIPPLPVAVEQFFAKDTSAVFKTYKPPYVLVPVEEHATDPIPFIGLQAVVHPFDNQ